MVKFKAKVWKVGCSHVITVPVEFIDDGKVKPYTKITVEIKK